MCPNGMGSNFKVTGQKNTHQPWWAAILGNSSCNSYNLLYIIVNGPYKGVKLCIKKKYLWKNYCIFEQKSEKNVT